MTSPPMSLIGVLLLSFGMTASLAVYVTRPPRWAGAVAFSVSLAGVAAVSLSSAAALLSSNEIAKAFFIGLKYLGFWMVFSAWPIFILQYTDQARRVSTKLILALSIIPFIVVLMRWAEILSDSALFVSMTAERDLFRHLAVPWTLIYPAGIVYVYLVTVFGAVRMIWEALRAPELYRGQRYLLVAGSLVPLVGDFLSRSGLSPWPELDLTALSFSVTGILFSWAILRYRALNLMPIARGVVMESMSDAVIVLNPAEEIVDYNPAAFKLISPNGEKKKIIGESLASVLPIENPYHRANAPESEDIIEREANVVGVNGAPYQMGRSSLRDRHDYTIGTLIVLRDIVEETEFTELLHRELAERRRIESQLRRLNEELEQRVKERTRELENANVSLLGELQYRKKVDEALRKSEGRYALAIQGANDGIWDWDLQTNLVFYSPRWKAIFGYPEDAIGNDLIEWFSRIHPEDVGRVKSELDAHLNGDTDVFYSEHRILRGQGNYIWVLTRGLAVRDEEGKAIRIAGSLSDIDSRKNAENTLVFNALHDPLTGLPNRALCLDRIDGAIKRSARRPGYQFSVFYLDFDHFKSVNDTWGHSVGDKLMVVMSGRLTECIRATDSVARMGGDEFVILVEDLRATDEVHQVLERVQTKINEPFVIDGHAIYMTASIGVVSGNLHFDGADDILRCADVALYRAKASGRACAVEFESQMLENVVSRMRLENDLRLAVERREFVLHYQPIVTSDTMGVTILEALVRWNHPERGLLMPGSFISLAEETGLILPLGDWILREACRQLHEWNALLPAQRRIKMAINVSSKQFSDPQFYENLTSAIADMDVSPYDLMLEITESYLMDDPNIPELLHNIKKLGIGIQIDDFGTGYSSLSYLHQLPIDSLKIDRSFIVQLDAVPQLNSDGDSRMVGEEIVLTIINLAKELGLSVIGEGVETQHQADQLRHFGCNYMQGFLFHRPADAVNISQMLGVSGKMAGPDDEMNELRSFVNSDCAQNDFPNRCGC
jgi:diguanylate cyclase (GGDEF)-like protein/PAS domain S-box-containing protein